MNFIDNGENLSILIKKKTMDEKLSEVWNGDIVTDKNVYPFLVSVDLVNNPEGSINKHECGGTLIAPTWVLTGGHCVTVGDINPVQDASNVNIRYNVLDYGVDEGVSVPVKRVLRHPLYNTTGGTGLEIPNYDVGLIELEYPIPIPTVKLASQSGSSDAFQPGKKAVVAGWGLYKAFEVGPSPELRQSETEIMTNAAVRSSTAELSGKKLYNEYFDSSNMLGGTPGLPPDYGKGFSPGDSGGPLLITDSNGSFTQIGTVSWLAYPGQEESPNIYAKVIDSENRRWIDNIVFSDDSGYQWMYTVMLAMILLVSVLLLFYFIFRQRYTFRNPKKYD